MCAAEDDNDDGKWTDNVLAAADLHLRVLRVGFERAHDRVDAARFCNPRLGPSRISTSFQMSSKKCFCTE